ncbi:Lysosomal alpha-mannosidase, partial [Bulinus truncatus]
SKSTRPFVKHVLKQLRSYRSNHLLVTMGSDFGYRKSENWFRVMDHLIDDVNKMEPVQGHRMKLLFSTPSCYTHYVNRKPRDLELKTDDFLPYSSADGIYWTGFYTSRPGVKRYVKFAGLILQSCKQMMLFAELYDMQRQVDVLRDAVSVMQHHDAITGTHRKNVTVSYSRMLSNGIAACQSVMSRAYSKLWWMTDDQENLTVATQFCPDLNISSCPVSEFNHKFYVSLYNPLAWTVSTSLKFPITSCTVDVSEGFKDLLPVQIVPVPEHIKRIQERSTHAEREAVLRVSIPPMSYETFFVKQMGCKTQMKPTTPASSHTRRRKPLTVIQNEYLALYFNGSTGRLVMIKNKEIQLTEQLAQGFSIYNSYFDGAYSFLAHSQVPVTVNPDGPVELKVVKVRP